MNYKEDGYAIIKKALSFELADFIYDYFILKRKAIAWAYKNKVIQETPFLGTWKDLQVPNTYSIYGDPLMDTLLMKVLPRMQKDVGLELVPTYSYARLYKRGDILKRHKDRPSCEVSTTIYLGGDKWSIFIDPTGKRNSPKGNEVLLDIGDMLVYSGCELEHWRESFQGNVCAQVFLHYNHANGPFAEKNKFDERPLLGVPRLTKFFEKYNPIG